MDDWVTATPRQRFRAGSSGASVVGVFPLTGASTTLRAGGGRTIGTPCDVHINVIAKGEKPSRVRVDTVRFAPCARTAWHAHALGQTLHVTDGVGLVQSRGGEVVVIRPGDVIWTPPGEWHWHGAAPDQFMVHTAIWEGDEAEWGDLVTDAEYGYPAQD